MANTILNKLVTKENANTAAGGIGVFLLSSAVWWFWGVVQQLPPFEIVLAVLLAFIVVIVVALVFVYVKKNLGINVKDVVEVLDQLLDIINGVKEQQEALKQQLSQITTALARPMVTEDNSTEILNTKFGQFTRKAADPKGTYYSMIDLGQGAMKAVYLDIEKWEVDGGKNVQGTSNKADSIVISRFGLHQNGYYIKEDNTVFSPSSADIFKPFIEEEMRQRIAYRNAVMQAYKNFITLEATAGRSRLYNGKNVTAADVDAIGFETIVKDIVSMGFGLDAFIKSFQSKPEAQPTVQPAPEQIKPTDAKQ